jgi:predicted ATPase/class 3 adenylate cyclase
VAELPTGTVTFLFTDIEGSTRLLDELGPNAYADALAAHQYIVRAALAAHDGAEVDTQGDAFFCVFASARDAVAAVLEIQQELTGPIRVRAGLHSGEALLHDDRYIGTDVHRAARVGGAGHGGQTILTASTAGLLEPGTTELRDLGEHRLKDLTAPVRLYQLEIDGRPDEFPPLRSLHRTNLPVPASPLIGRERELQEVAELFSTADARLVTFTGPGGVGKTRLALQAVAEAAEGFPQGVWWVPLASLRDPGLVLASVALALGVREQPGQRLEETLLDVLLAGRTILLLDNLEHLLPAAAASVATLRDAGGAKVVITSRERLQLSGEHVYTVAPLAASEAVELFCARTSALGFDPGDAESIAELCSRLDNLPLAIELAAARAGLLAPAEILSRLGDRLDRLKAGRDADPRQQTLRATIGWSYDLLDRSERDLFAMLAVFAGGATIDAIEAVCNADLDVLASLLDKSLVRKSGERLWMLETVREFASEQLAADPTADELGDRHADYYLTLAESWDRELRGPGQGQALERFAAERENVRAAVERLLERDPSKALRLAAALWVFSFMRGHFREGRELLAVALAQAPAEPTETRASALVGAGLLASEQGDHQVAFDLLEEGLACARATGSTSIEANALSLLASFTKFGKDEQIRLGDEAIAKARVSGDRWMLGCVIGNQGAVMWQLGETEKAAALTEEALRLCGAVGDVSLTAIWLLNLAGGALREGNWVAARARLNEVLELARIIDDTRVLGYALGGFGWLELNEGKRGPAISYFQESAEIAQRLGIRGAGAEAIWGLAQAAAAAGDADRAARLGGAAVAYGGPAGFDRTDYFPSAGHMDAALAVIGEPAWQKAWAEGTQLDFDAALKLGVNPNATAQAAGG